MGCGPRCIMDRLFEDKRCTCVLLIVWLTTSVSIFWYLGAFHVQFMTVGPSEETVFMGLTIDNWPKWYCLAGFSFCNTAINEFLSSALGPWFINTVQDHKCVNLPYTKFTCLFISQILIVYEHIMSIFGIFLLFSQIDFMILRMCADILVNQYSMNRFMMGKKVVLRGDKDTVPFLPDDTTYTLNLNEEDDFTPLSTFSDTEVNQP
jgi:hypothetical protein